MKKTAYIYCRFSDEKQSKGFSIELQKEACESYCNQQNINVIGTFVDRAKTGTNSDRDAFQQMMLNIKQKKQARHVVVYKLDRFGRNIANYYLTKVELAKYGCEILSVTETMGEGPESILMEAIYNGLAESESVRIGMRAKAGMLQSVKQGKWQNGLPPFGYDKNEEKKLIINKEEMYIIKNIFKLYLDDNLGTPLIADRLNKEGYRRRRGMPFNPMAVRYILANKVYIGGISFGGELYENTHESIVTKEDYRKVQEKLLYRRNKRRSVMKNTNYPLTGLIACKLCGSTYSGKSAKNGAYHYYVCNNVPKMLCTAKRISKKKLEEKVIEKIKTLSDGHAILEQVVKRFIQDAKDFYDSHHDKAKILRKSLKQTDKEISNVVSAISRIGGDELDDKLRQLRQKKEESIKSLEKFEEMPAILTVDEVGDIYEEILGYVKTYIKNLDASNLDIRKWVKNISLDEYQEPIVDLNMYSSDDIWLPRLMSRSTKYPNCNPGKMLKTIRYILNNYDIVI